MDIYTLFGMGTRIVGYLLIGLVVLLILFFAVIPIMKLQKYKKQGLPTLFFFMWGFLRRDRKYEKTAGDLMGYYKQLAKTNPTIRAMAANFSNRVDVFLYDPNLIKEFYQNQSFYKKNPTTQILSTLLGNGLAMAGGDVWKQHRKVISGIFHFEFLRESVPLITRTTKEFLDRLATTDMKNLDILKETQKITGEIIGRLFFSENLNNYTLNGQPLTLFLAEIPARASAVFRKPLAIIFLVTRCKMERLTSYRAIMKDIAEFRRVCAKIVADRKASNLKANDLMGRLLETQNALNPEDQFSDEQIVDEFATFFLGGMDTTAHLVCMALYLLAVNPSDLEKLQKEIEEVYAKNHPAPIETINQMEYLHAVQKETLRMYGPAPIPAVRRAQVDHKLLDIEIKKGDFVRPMAMYNYFHDKYFEDPNKFIPSRWLNKKEQGLDPYVFIPFSAGPRNCIGQHLALLMTKIIIAEFFKQFNFKIQDDYKLVMSMGSQYEPKEKVLVTLSLK